MGVMAISEGFDALLQFATDLLLVYYRWGRNYAAAIFFPGMALLFLLALYLNLFQFDGTPLQRRNAWSIAIATFVLVVVCLIIDLGEVPIFKTLILTGILFAGQLISSIRHMKANLRGHEVIIYKAKRLQQWLTFLVIFMCVAFWDTFFNDWIILVLLGSSFLWSICFSLYVMKLEKKIGEKIIERKEA